MPDVKTDLLNNLETCSLQDLANAGLNPFAVRLLVESYRVLVASLGKTPTLEFAHDGVALKIEPFRPDGVLEGKESSDRSVTLRFSTGPEKAA